MPDRSIPCAIALCALCAAAASAGLLGTEFTYQGTLSESGSPANGAYDFRILLYDADVGGSQVGSIAYVDDLAVTDGRVVTQLDFGALFDGTALWLEIHVRDGASTGSYSVLFPRQELTAGPYAQHAVQAQSATVAGDADMLDGQDSPYYLAWGNLTGVPGGLDDGDDDTLGALTCADGEVAKWNGAAWNCRPDEGVTYARTYLVGPVGTAIENGTALLAAMAAIPAPASQEDARLLKIEPGLFDLGSGSLVMKQWVDVEGSGRDVTRLTSTACGDLTGTVMGAADTELRLLAVENTCSATFANAVFNASTGFRMAQADMFGGSATTSSVRGLSNEGDQASLVDVRVTVQGLSTVAIANTGHNVTLTRITATATSIGPSAIGVYSGGDSCVLTGITATVDGGTSSNRAIYIAGDGVVSDAIATATGSLSTGIYVRGTDVTVNLRNVTTDGSLYGLHAVEITGGGLIVSCHGCQLYGTTYSVWNSSSLATVQIGVSQLDGPVSGSPTCAGVYDENYVFYASSCPP